MQKAAGSPALGPKSKSATVTVRPRFIGDRLRILSHIITPFFTRFMRHINGIHSEKEHTTPLSINQTMLELLPQSLNTPGFRLNRSPMDSFVVIYHRFNTYESNPMLCPGQRKSIFNGM